MSTARLAALAAVAPPPAFAHAYLKELRNRFPQLPPEAFARLLPAAAAAGLRPDQDFVDGYLAAAQQLRGGFGADRWLPAATCSVLAALAAAGLRPRPALLAHAAGTRCGRGGCWAVAAGRAGGGCGGSGRHAAA